MDRQDPVKDKILQTCDIVEFIRDYVKLDHRGRNFIGLCPFHNEKTPSFNVNPEGQYFKCFGCGKSGDIFDFVMSMENLTFPEARNFLALKHGIPVEPPKNRKRDERDIDRYAIMEQAAQLFRHWLGKNAAPREYLHNRGLSGKEIETFGLGYAPPGWENLHKAMNERGVPADIQCELGLVIEGQKRPGHYDRFRNRIIFPIRNTLGRVIAFGGRALDPSDPAKYLNSNDTPIFNKSKVLYLLDRAKNSIRDQGAILVEGYMDAIALHAHGITRAVAGLGTALTAEHIRVLRRYTNRFTLLYDSDAAGTAAALRGVELFAEAGLSVRVLRLPGGKDPDEFLQHHKAEELAELIENAPEGFRFALSQAMAGKNAADPETRIEIVQSLRPLLDKVSDAMRVREYLRITAGELGMGLDQMERAHLNGARGKPAPAVKTPAADTSAGGNPPTPAAGQKKPFHLRVKWDLIRLLACHLKLAAPPGGGENGKIVLFSRDLIENDLPAWLEMLNDRSNEDQVLARIMETAGKNSNPPAGFLKQLFPEPSLLDAYITIMESEPLPPDMAAYRDACLENLRREIRERVKQGLLRKTDIRDMDAQKKKMMQYWRFLQSENA